MKQEITIGVVCFARKTFDYQAALDKYKEIQNNLNEIDNTKFEFINELVIEIEDAKNAAINLLKKNIDALVCISGTFHLGHLVLEMNKILRKPIMLWGLHELPYNGGKIRLNSVCGVNLNASNLYKSGVRNYFANLGDEIDRDWLDAIRIQKAFSTSHVGILGYRARGFFNIGIYDLNTYSQMGVLVDHYELAEVFNMEVDPQKVENRKTQYKDLFDISGISEQQLDKVANLVVKFNNFINKHNIDALAVRCWPEFASQYGISPCAAMSLLQSEDKIMTCEGDIDGSLSMLAHKAIGGETPFLFDFSQVNIDENFALLWHCGVAPCNLWDRKSNRSLDTYFAGGRGVTVDFVMKTGDVSLLRIDSAGDEYRLFLGKAKGVHMNKELKGSYLKVIFEEPVKDILYKIIENGIAHHASLVYGDFNRTLEIYAKLQGWKVIK